MFLALTASVIRCANTEGNHQCGELFNSHCLVKLYYKYIICFLFFFVAVFFFSICWVVSAVCFYILPEFEAVNYCESISSNQAIKSSAIGLERLTVHIHHATHYLAYYLS